MEVTDSTNTSWLDALAEDCIRCRQQHVDDIVTRRTIAWHPDPTGPRQTASDRVAQWIADAQDGWDRMHPAMAKLIGHHARQT